jgi:hypothetical protein
MLKVSIFCDGLRIEEILEQYDIRSRRLRDSESQRRRGRYRQVSIRFPALFVTHLRDLASREGWELSDFIRSLIVVGATGAWLGLTREENLNRLKDISSLGQAAGMIGAALTGRAASRPYATRSYHPSEVISAFVPHTYASIVKEYARLRRISKNQAYAHFLEGGLVAYMQAENSVLTAIQMVRKREREFRSSIR